MAFFERLWSNRVSIFLRGSCGSYAIRLRAPRDHDQLIQLMGLVRSDALRSRKDSKWVRRIFDKYFSTLSGAVITKTKDEHAQLVRGSSHGFLRVIFYAVHMESVRRPCGDRTVAVW